MKIFSRRLTQLSEEQLPIFRVHVDDRVFAACILIGTFDDFPKGLCDCAQQTLSRVVKVAGSRFEEGQVWGLEVEQMDDAEQQVADAVAFVHDRGAVAFLCPRTDTADHVVHLLEALG